MTSADFRDKSGPSSFYSFRFFFFLTHFFYFGVERNVCILKFIEMLD
jgi:hypothetical protein